MNTKILHKRFFRFDERIKDKFDEWVFFLKTETIQPTFTAQGIKSAAKKLDILSL